MRYRELDRPRLGRDHRNVLVVAGPPGVGKSTLVRAVLQSNLFAEDIIGEAVEVGDMIFETTRNLTRRAANKDKIKEVSQEKVDVWLGYVLGLTAGIYNAEENVLLLVAQPVYQQNGKLISAAHYYRDMRPAGYVHVYAEPKQTQEWRRQEPTRTRSEQTRRQIAAHQRASLRVTDALARETGARLITVWNRPDNVPENVNKIRALGYELFL